MNINQVMLAIQRENPDAFLRDNINLLKRGAILRMPSAAEVELISAATAQHEVAAQQEAFSGYTAAVTAASPETPLLAEQSAAGAFAQDEPAVAGAEPATAADEPAAAEAAAGESAAAETTPESVPEQDLLELVPPSADSELDSAAGFEEAAEDAGADVAAQALREDLARTEEELITQQQQNEYLEERIRELESQLESRDEGRVTDEDLAHMEDRLREQRQVAAQAPREQTRPWYARMGVWLIGLLVLAAAFVGWLVSRRGAGSGAGTTESLRDIKSEAEDVLRVLADDREQQPAARAAAGQPRPDAGKEPGIESGKESGKVSGKEPGQPEAAADKTAPGRFGADDDAELLDEESSDPEIQLDLARAYISMGDKEAARVILQEVVSNGSEEQQAEARKMLDFL
jgi:FimV-like protein